MAIKPGVECDFVNVAADVLIEGEGYDFGIYILIPGAFRQPGMGSRCSRADRITIPPPRRPRQDGLLDR